MLNRLWISFFLLSFASCVYQWLFLGNAAVFTEVVSALFAMAKTSVDIAIGLIGIMCLWLGIFKIAEHSRLVDIVGKLLAPLLTRLMPEVPKGHEAHSAITMNMAANVLGLDNAATPLGIKAMQSLQSLNPTPLIASNAQILFLVLNTSSVTLLPVTIFMYRAQAQAASATDVFLPILLATSCSTLAGLLAVAVVQKIKLYQPVVLAYLLGFSLLMSSLMLGLQSLPAEQLADYSSFTANVILLSFIVSVIAYGAYKKHEVYELFIEGAKDGFSTAIGIIPYLVAMLVAIAALRASGVLDVCISAIAFMAQGMGLPTDFVAALPTGLMKPFSGSGSRALMLESFQVYGVDSLIGRMTAVMQGSTETTFYVLAVYFGSVGIRYGRHAVACGLIADAAGIIAAIVFSYVFFA
jgi:spore maturation protein SpmA